jgi:hypothetical protein
MRYLLTGYDPIDTLREPAQVLSRRRYIDINDAAQLIVIYLRRRIDLLHASDRTQVGRLCSVAGTHRNLFKVGERLNLRFRKLHRQKVVVARLRIDIVTRRNHAV